MPNGVYFNQAAPGAAVNMFQPTMQNSRSHSTIEIEESFPDVMAFIEKNYRTAKGFANTAGHIWRNWRVYLTRSCSSNAIVNSYRSAIYPNGTI